MSLRIKEYVFRFRLRALFVALAAASVVLSIGTIRTHKMRAAIADVVALGGRVWMSNECSDDGQVTAGPFLSRPPSGWVLAWISRARESDYFRTVYCVDLRNSGIANDQLLMLQSFPKLRRVYLSNTEVDDVGMSHLATLRHVRYVDLNSTNVTSVGVASLSRNRSDLVIRWDGDLERQIDLEKSMWGSNSKLPEGVSIYVDP